MFNFFDSLKERFTKSDLKRSIAMEFEYIVNKHYNSGKYPISNFCDKNVTSIKIKHSLFNNRLDLYLVMKRPGVFIGCKGKDCKEVIRKLNDSFPNNIIKIASIKEHKLY